jgi:N-acetylmuramoyl-L-alanine amidase
MFTAGENDRGPVQRVCAWAGLLLIAVSLVWLESLPPREYPLRPIGEAPALEGPINRVVIDPGHGGKDSGTMHAGVSEKDLTLDVARRLDLLLRARGLATTMTRSGDETVSLGTRAALANQERDCVFVSIHFDESRASATGVQTFYAGQQTPKPAVASSWWPFGQKVSSSINPESQSLAGMIQDELVIRTQAFDRGTRAQQFYVIANVYHPAVLVEGGFLTNNDDMVKLASEEYRQQLAVALTDGIMRYREIVVQGSPTLALGAPGR